jgi:hypothetical protein
MFEGCQALQDAFTAFPSKSRPQFQLGQPVPVDGHRRDARKIIDIDLPTGRTRVPSTLP